MALDAFQKKLMTNQEEPKGGLREAKTEGKGRKGWVGGGGIQPRRLLSSRYLAMCFGIVIEYGRKLFSFSTFSPSIKGQKLVWQCSS